jgi:hypothetical protein
VLLPQARAFPGIFDRGRRHPALIGAAAGDPLGRARPVLVLPRALDRDLPADRFNFPFKGADVTVSVGVHVHEVAALRTVAADQVAHIPIGDAAGFPILLASFLEAGLRARLQRSLPLRNLGLSLPGILLWQDQRLSEVAQAVCPQIKSYQPGGSDE